VCRLPWSPRHVEFLAILLEIGYDKRMEEQKISTRTDGLTLEEAVHLQSIESNPLTPDEVAMFRRFDREGWSDEQRLAYLRKHVLERIGVPAAE